MPISHPHKSIFVHIPKTAGTAVEAVLGMHGEKIDVGIVPYYNQRLDFEHLYGRQMQHMTALEIRTALNDDALFSSYFKFSIVRNPWDRLVSALAWTDQKWARGIELSRSQFESQLHQIHGYWKSAGAGSKPAGFPRYLYPQHDYVFDAGGTRLVEFIAKYESLSTDWDQLQERLGLRVYLPVRMKSHHQSYQSYYCPETRDLVAAMYRQDIVSFGYDF